MGGATEAEGLAAAGAEAGGVWEGGSGGAGVGEDEADVEGMTTDHQTKS